MDEYLKKALAIILRGMEAQVNCGIQAMHMQALKGRVPNNQSQYFMQNTNNNLLSMAMGAPNLINGVVPQQQNGQMDQVAQLIQLAKEEKTKTAKPDIRIVKLEKNVSALVKSVEALAASVSK